MSAKKFEIDNEEFESAWLEFKNAYPRRHTRAACDFAGAKVKALKLAESRGMDVMRDLITAARAYHAEMAQLRNVGTPYVKMASSWINSGRWANYLEPEGAPPEKTSPSWLKDVEDVMGREHA